MTDTRTLRQCFRDLFESGARTFWFCLAVAAMLFGCSVNIPAKALKAGVEACDRHGGLMWIIGNEPSGGSNKDTFGCKDGSRFVIYGNGTIQ